MRARIHLDRTLVRGSRRLVAVAAMALGAAVLVLPTAANAVSTFNVPCSVPALITAINNANAAGTATINLASGCTYDITSPDHPHDGLPTITGNLTINGNGATITRDAGALPFRILDVTGQLKMNSATLSNGSLDPPSVGGEEGGDLFVAFGAQATLSSMTITGGRAQEGGGIATEGTLSASNVKINGNTAINNGCGGGLYIGSGVSNNTMITGNSPLGGGIYSDGQLTVNGSTITNNSVPGTRPEGGGVWNDGPAGFTNTQISGNTVTGSINAKC